MWLLFVRNGACSGGKRRDREIWSLHWRCRHSCLSIWIFIYMCLSVCFHGKRERWYVFNVHRFVWAHLKKKPIKNKTGERGKGQRVEVIMLQGIWRSDLLCEVVKVWKVKCFWILQELVRTPKNKKKESMCSRNKETKTQDKKACKMYVNKTLD